MTREKFIERAYDVKKGWLDAYFEQNLNKILDSGIIDLDNIPEHYGPVYPVVAAILEAVCNVCIYGGSESRAAARTKNKILRSIRLV
jgi:hypothetical protein